MKKGIYCIYDSKAEAYNDPVYFQNDQVAMRAAVDLVSQGDNQIRNHPQDFTLFKIGEYDDETAQIKAADKFEVVCRFHEISTEQATAADIEKQLMRDDREAQLARISQ